MSDRRGGFGAAEQTVGRAVLTSAAAVAAVVVLVMILLALFGRAVPGSGDGAGAGASGTTTSTATTSTAGPTDEPSDRTLASPAPTSRAAGSDPAGANPPTETDATPADSSPTSVGEVPDIGVVVLNQSARRGLATEVAGTLQAAGWRIADTGNWRGAVPVTTVYYPIGFESAAQALAADLDGVDRIRPRQANMPNGVLTVIIHESYAG